MGLGAPGITRDERTGAMAKPAEDRRCPVWYCTLKHSGSGAAIRSSCIATAWRVRPSPRPGVPVRCFATASR